jgi:AcrR family transcriptional regulator
MNAGSTKRTATPSRRDEARALFRNAILEAAEAVFAERGFHAARIQDIAERGRTAVGTVYNHFETKEDVLRALLEERTEGMARELSPQPGDGDTFEKRLTARLTRVLAHITRHQGFFAIAFEHGLIGGSSGAASSALGNKRIRSIEKFKTGFRALIQEGIDDGTLEAIDASRLSRFLGGAMRAFMIGGFEEGTRIEEEAPLIVSLFLHGAAKRSRRK